MAFPSNVAAPTYATAPQPVGIVLIGFQGAGKTHFISGLTLPRTINTSVGETSMRPEDKETSLYLRKVEPRSGEHTFTEPTIDPTPPTLTFRVECGGEEKMIAVSDSMGADWLELREQPDAAMETFVRDLGTMTGVVFVLDPAFVYDKERHRETIDGIIRSMMQNVFARWPKSQLRNNRLPMSAALVLSKADRFFGDDEGATLVRRLEFRNGVALERMSSSQDWSELHLVPLPRAIKNNNEGVRRFLVEHSGDAMRSVVGTLEQYFDEVGYHAVSFVGMTRANGSVVPNVFLRPLERRDEFMLERRSEAVPVPINLHAPFVQILWPDEWKSAQSRGFRFQPLYAVAFGLVVALMSGIAYLIWGLTQPS